MATMSNGCITVNGGTLYRFPDGFEVEIMGKGFSSHPDNLTATYVRPKEGKSEKVLVYVNDKGECFISFYKKLTDLHHFSSRKYSGRQDLPQKYIDVYLRLLKAHKTIFGRQE